jgi:hypothetical protein
VSTGGPDIASLILTNEQLRHRCLPPPKSLIFLLRASAIAITSHERLEYVS